MLRTLAPILVLLLVASCDRNDHHGPEHHSAEGFVRLPAPGSDMSAAYLTVVRDEDDRLIAASVEGVERTELHTVIEENGVMRMRPVEGYDVRAGEPLILQPGGHHLMLFGLDSTLMGGETREVTLIFESGKREVIELPVKAQTGMGSPGEH